MSAITNRAIRSWMIEHLEEHRDDCGEINATGLAEGCCLVLDGYEGDDIPEAFFEIAGWLSVDDERKQAARPVEREFPCGEFAPESHESWED